MRLTRRNFIGSSLSLPFLEFGRVQSKSPHQNRSFFDPWIEVHRENIRHNVAQISKRTKRPILAVIKNNGYGLGLLNTASTMESLESVAGFAVVKLQEAMTLRDGGIRKPILLMGSSTEQELGDIVARDITPMVYTPLGAALEAVSRKLRKPVPIHVCVDTGVGRVGVPHDKALHLVRDLARYSGVRLAGIMMTFTEDKEFDHEQFRRFQSLILQLKKEGIEFDTKHAVSSFGLFQHPDKFLDMVRPGMALFGIYPEPQFRSPDILDLRPAVSLKTRVIYVKQLQAGESAGYNRVFRPDNNTWLATLPVGHADGLPRAVVKGARVRIGNEFFPLVAISASHVIADIGTEPRVHIGDVATLFNWKDGSRPEDFAASFEGSVYDLTMHLNPLLPRVIQ